MAYRIIHGDSLEVLSKIKTDSLDFMVTDPPAGIGFMGKDWDSDKTEQGQLLRAELRELAGTDEAFRAMLPYLPHPWVLWLSRIMKEARRVLKPGAHVAVWALPRTAHWTGQAVEMAGFEIITTFAHLFSTGMPKNTNVPHAVDKQLGIKRKTTEPTVSDLAREYEGRGTAIAPAREDWIIARVPRDGTIGNTIERYGTGTVEIDGCRLEVDEKHKYTSPASDTPVLGKLTYGQMGRIETKSHDGGRWPRDVSISPDVAFGLGPAARFYYCPKVTTKEREAGLENFPRHSAGQLTGRKDGSEGLKNARAGAGRTSNGRANNHPTVKPLNLCRYLIRLVAPRGGRGIDPFCGSGSIIAAGALEGVSMIGIDQDQYSCRIAEARAKHWASVDSVPALPLLPGEVRRTSRKLPEKTADLNLKVRGYHDRVRDVGCDISATVRRALDHYFGIFRDVGGEPAPGLAFASPMDWAVTINYAFRTEPWRVKIFEDQKELLGKAEELGTTPGALVRAALSLYLYGAQFQQDESQAMAAFMPTLAKERGWL